MTPEFRAGERVISVKLCCTECGGRAQGNASWTDGSGEICDACVAKDEAPAVETSAPVLTTGCGQYRVQDCLCGDCEALDTPESFANQAQRAQGSGRPEQDRDAIAFGYPTWRG